MNFANSLQSSEVCFYITCI